MNLLLFSNPQSAATSVTSIFMSVTHNSVKNVYDNAAPRENTTVKSTKEAGAVLSVINNDVKGYPFRALSSVSITSLSCFAISAATGADDYLA